MKVGGSRWRRQLVDGPELETLGARMAARKADLLAAVDSALRP
jgi:hypothetical protein